MNQALPLWLVTALVASSSASLSAGEPATAQERLEAVLENEPGLTPETKQALLEALESVDDHADATPAGNVKAPQEPEEPSVWDKLAARLEVYGDLRLRHESNFELDSQDDRHRERVRFRLGATYRITDELEVGARVTTGARDDPNSPHVTLGDGFDRFELNLDRAYLNYKPEALQGLSITGGKFWNSFLVNPVYGELEWDQDVQPEGILGEYIWKGNAAIRSLELRVGEYILLEQADAKEALSTVGQIGARFAPHDSWNGLAAVGYSLYTDVTPDGNPALVADSQGNALVDTNGDGVPDDYESDFGVLHPILALTYTGGFVPVTLAAEYFWNTRAKNSRDQGYAVGIGVGRTKSRGDWKLDYQWQVIQQDAVFSAFANDDFLLTTNQKGHLVSLNYQIWDAVGVRTWALISHRLHTTDAPTSNSDSAQWRVRLDINVSF